MKYPTRCRIVDVSGNEVFPGLTANTPEISKPHIGKLGLAEKINDIVRITLDDGNLLYGYECWWEPIIPEPSPDKDPESLNGEG
jgi:hypothetical protein